MLRFVCPRCQKRLKAAEDQAGRKCTCGGCGQVIVIPGPAAAGGNGSAADFTCQDCGRRFGVPDDHVGTGAPIVCPRCGQHFTGQSNQPSPPVRRQPPPGHSNADEPGEASVTVTCPGCGRAILLPPHELCLRIECARCGARFVPGQSPEPPEDFPRPPASGSGTSPREGWGGEPPRGHDAGVATSGEHSGLGMASFIIALVVGGLNLIVILGVTLSIARSGHLSELKANMLGGSMAVICLNFMSVPVCLVGVGLAVVGLNAHPDRNHFFTRIGLVGNGTVVLAVIGFLILAHLL